MGRYSVRLSRVAAETVEDHGSQSTIAGLTGARGVWHNRTKRVEEDALNRRVFGWYQVPGAADD